jgi:hypothetical protein
MTAFAVVSDAIKPRHFFGSPVLYVLLVLSWVIGFPLFAVLHRWLKARLVRYLLCGGVLALAAFALLWMKWGGPPPFNFRALLGAAGTRWSALSCSGRSYGCPRARRT